MSKPMTRHQRCDSDGSFPYRWSPKGGAEDMADPSPGEKVGNCPPGLRGAIWTLKKSPQRTAGLGLFSPSWRKLVRPMGRVHVGH